MISVLLASTVSFMCWNIEGKREKAALRKIVGIGTGQIGDKEWEILIWSGLQLGQFAHRTSAKSELN